METKETMVIIPLKEYQELIDFKKAVVNKMYFKVEKYNIMSDTSVIYEYYFNDQKTRDEFNECKEQISKLKDEKWELRQDIRKALNNRLFRKALKKSNKYGN